MLPKMSGYTKRFNETKDMFFFFREYDVLLEKYSKTCDSQQ